MITWPPMVKPQLEPGRLVLTPSGATAIVVLIDHNDKGEIIEALVEWPNKQQARFRVKHLRPLPRDAEKG